jgi:hypothetical protein
MSKMACPEEYLSFFNRVLDSTPKRPFTNLSMPVGCWKEIEELAEKKAFFVKAVDAMPNAAVVWGDARVVVLYRTTVALEMN